MDIESLGSAFTYHGEPISAINRLDHKKFIYITDPMYNLPEQQDNLPTIFSIDTLFSDNTFERLIQTIRPSLITRISQKSRKAFDEEIVNLKSQLLELVATLDDLQSNRSEFYESLLERAFKKLNITLEQKLQHLRKHRDTLLNSTKFPKEVDATLEEYIEDFYSLRDFDFKSQTKDLMHSLSIPFTLIHQEVEKVRSFLTKLQAKVRSARTARVALYFYARLSLTRDLWI